MDGLKILQPQAKKRRRNRGDWLRRSRHVQAHAYAVETHAPAFLMACPEPFSPTPCRQYLSWSAQKAFQKGTRCREARREELPASRIVVMSFQTSLTGQPTPLCAD